MAEPKTEEQLTFLTSLAYVEEMATGVQGQRRLTWDMDMRENGSGRSAFISLIIIPFPVLDLRNHYLLTI